MSLCNKFRCRHRVPRTLLHLSYSHISSLLPATIFILLFYIIHLNSLDQFILSLTYLTNKTIIILTTFLFLSLLSVLLSLVGGILSLNQEENPFWYRANHVLIPYCSSDSWTGNHRARNPGEFSFLGSRIIEQVILELLPQGLHESDLMVLAGESAGAVGVLTNLDRVSELMALVGSRTQVRGLADSGWFLDNKPFEFNRDGRTSGSKSNLCHTSPHNCPPVEGIKLGIRSVLIMIIVKIEFYPSDCFELSLLMKRGKVLRSHIEYPIENKGVPSFFHDPDDPIFFVSSFLSSFLSSSSPFLPLFKDGPNPPPLPSISSFTFLPTVLS